MRGHRAPLLAGLFALLSLPARAHFNSPDVFLDEPVGPYAATVAVRMPSAVPGEALVEIRLLDPGGILVTSSCSHHMSEAMLFQIVAEASLDAGKTIRILERRTQASDHPILLTVPETLYLKCLILEVLAP